MLKCDVGDVINDCREVYYKKEAVVKIQKLLKIVVCAVFISSITSLSALRFVVTILSYNNAKWYERNLNSIFSQAFPADQFRVVYIDDCSSDGTGQLVEDYIERHGYQNRVTLVRNTERKRAMCNMYTAVHDYCADDEIVVSVDGDDWLAHSQVFKRLAQEYQNPNVWLVYAQYQNWPANTKGFSRPVPPRAYKLKSFRSVVRTTSQLRSFYAWIFKRIKREDLMWKGQFFYAACDVAYMLPIFEMVAERNRFIPEILYIYNRATPINDHKVNLEAQMECNKEIRLRPPYARLP